jgi:hypothetical protein
VYDFSKKSFDEHVSANLQLCMHAETKKWYLGTLDANIVNNNFGQILKICNLDSFQKFQNSPTTNIINVI